MASAQTHKQTGDRGGEKAERDLRERGCSFDKNIFIILLRARVCCRGRRLTRPSQSCAVRSDTIYSLSGFGSAAGWCNSRKYRPSAVLAAVSVHEWQTTVNAKREKKNGFSADQRVAVIQFWFVQTADRLAELGSADDHDI